MPLPGADAFRVAEAYRLGLEDTARRGVAGERLGRGTGSSLEFQDRRGYVPGDDVRHLDWRAFARTDQMMVRLYREEILPRVEIVVDASRSMAVEPEKAQLAVDLATLLVIVCRESGFGAQLISAGERAEVVPFDRLQVEGLAFDAAVPLSAAAEQCTPLLRPGSLRLLVSDFLSPHDPAALVRSFASGAGGVTLLQVLGAFDENPAEGSPLRLTDSETGEVLDLVLDARAIRVYRERLERLGAALHGEALRMGGRFLTMTGGTPLERVCRGRLCGEGVLVPA